MYIDVKQPNPRMLQKKKLDPTHGSTKPMFTSGYIITYSSATMSSSLTTWLLELTVMSSRNNDSPRLQTVRSSCSSPNWLSLTKQQKRNMLLQRYSDIY